MVGPLDGIKVLELSEMIAGPYAGMLLADMGADVIKVEPPWGEAWRLVQQVVPLESRPYMAVNRGKRSLPLDLTKPKGQEVLYKLVPDTDVMIVTYRPDVPKKLGIDYETMHAKNPRLVYCANRAFGTEGPQSRLPGYDLILQAMTGLMAAEGKTKDGVTAAPLPALSPRPTVTTPSPSGRSNSPRDPGKAPGFSLMSGLGIVSRSTNSWKVRRRWCVGVQR